MVRSLKLNKSKKKNKERMINVILWSNCKERWSWVRRKNKFLSRRIWN
jgi:hypothetical protein